MTLIRNLIILAVCIVCAFFLLAKKPVEQAPLGAVQEAPVQTNDAYMMSI